MNAGIETYDDPASPWFGAADGWMDFSEAELNSIAYVVHGAIAPARGRYLAEVAPLGFVLVENRTPCGIIAIAQASLLMSAGATRAGLRFDSMSRESFERFREVGRRWVATGSIVAMMDTAIAASPDTPVYSTTGTISKAKSERAAQVAPPQN